MSDIIRPSTKIHIEREYKEPSQALLYREQCTRTPEEQRQRIEALRYKWGGYKNGFRCMQRAGDSLRKMFPWLAVESGNEASIVEYQLLSAMKRALRERLRA